MSKIPKAVGVYISAGGFSIGIEEHYEIIAHLGDGKFGYETLRANYPEVDYFDTFDTWPMEHLGVLDVDLMYCAPPCAPWSLGGGKGKKLDTDPRVEKMGHAIGVGLEVEPKIWMLESVAGFPAKSGELISSLSQSWRDRGYSITMLYTNTLLYGLPQNRTRFDYMAHNVKLPSPEVILGAFPKFLPTVADVLPPDKPRSGEVFEDSSFSRNAVIIREYTPQGHRVRNVFRDLAGLEPGEPGGPSFNLYRLRPEYPAPTVISGPRIIHPNGQRLLTVREGMAICGFPAGYVIKGSNEDRRYRELGKGVLPPMAEFLGRWTAKGLSEGKRITTPTTAVVDWRDQSRRLLRQKPPGYPFPPELVGSMPELKQWYHSKETPIGTSSSKKSSRKKPRRSKG